MSENTRQGRRQSRLEKRNNEQKGKKPSKKSLFKKLVIIFTTIIVLAIIGGGVTIFAMIQGAPDLEEEKLTLSQAAQIYSDNDEFVSQLDATERRINVSIQDVPQVVEDAFISVEDVRFEQHFGIDIRRLFGAVAANITDGFGAEGASTITQQLVKNLFLNEQKKLTRKVQEQYLAIKLEQRYTKDQILEMYLNQIYLGSGAYGIEKASQTYFSKSVTELEIEDAALLAGIPRRPSYYDPTKNPEAAEKRRNLVISLMEKHGKITADEAEKAKNVPISEQINQTEREAYPYEAFYNQVLSELEQMDGITVNDLYNAGLKVYTTLDVEAQQHVENVLQTDEYIKQYPENEDFQAGVTLVDTKTGQIKAIGSGREDTGIQRGLNYATEIKKQPGSTIKPILDYGPAIEYLQWSTGKVIVDEPHTYNTGDQVRNFSRNYEGPMSMRRALTKSQNVPAIKALQEVGVDRAQGFAERLGVPIELPNGQSTMPEAYGLGGFETGVSTLHLAGAYAAFGNNGYYTKPYTVRKIEFPDGRVIDMTPQSTLAMSDYTAYMITDMLKSVMTEGTGRTANIPHLHVAGKTGTTNFSEEIQKAHNIPSGGVPDKWFAGYTTNYSVAVWTGFSKNGENNYLDQGSPLAQLIFKEIIEGVSKDKENEDFTMPNSVVRVGVERSTGLLPSEFTPQSEIVYELFVRGNEPTRVSEEFMKIPEPTDFTAGYDEERNQIIVSWNYPEEHREKVTFELQLTIDEESPQTLDRMKDMQYAYSSPEPGSTYRFEVVAIFDESANVKSKPVSAEVTIPAPVEEEPIDDDEIPDPLDEIEDPLDEIEDPSDEENPDDDSSQEGDADNKTPGNGKPARTEDDDSVTSQQNLNILDDNEQ
ncbi:transglycosylase domain-containing protein [Halalkalibacter urbisdiaboli]|uniref:transglycosylase domain-containing protein n=1 Tax=Halalkalibacter urbisdiaboli TaxID=1960589 RepID=UPI000B4456C6|nr:PBP1A family penicillin-binding protein [Halalkalibacter urbisdiaboli]